jgi:hypothetical protein
MEELTFERKQVTKFRNIFPAQAAIAEVLRVVLDAKLPGELRVGIPGNGGVNFIEFVEKEKTQTVYYEPDEKISVDNNGHQGI